MRSQCRRGLAGNENGACTVRLTLHQPCRNPARLVFYWAIDALWLVWYTKKKPPPNPPPSERGGLQEEPSCLPLPFLKGKGAGGMGFFLHTPCEAPAMTQETPTQPAPVETLRVQNFAGMTDVTLELSRMNVLIGPSASGKSVCAKLLFFFKQALWHIMEDVNDEESREQMQAGRIFLFLQYFPPANWGKDDFQIAYTWGEYQIKVSRNGQTSVAITFSQAYEDAIHTAVRRRRQTGISVSVEQVAPLLATPNYYIASGRAFFTTIDNNIYSLLSAGIEIDPFLFQIGRVYQKAASRHRPTREHDYGELVEKRIASILSGNYERDTTGGYIVHQDGRRVAVRNTSSGQQEALPLLLALPEIVLTNGRGFTVFIEEPEAHLYPTAQRDVVHLMAAVTDLFGSAEGSQYVLTTHSPYILSALNNLMYGGKIVKYSPDKKNKVTAILPEQVLVDPAHVRAYMMEGGGATSIIDPQSGLIEAKQLDTASNIMLRELRGLLDIEFGDEDKASNDSPKTTDEGEAA